MTADVTLVIGGVRSGKSRFAADLASRLAGDGPVLFVATARRGPSAGMEARIERHRANRPEHWQTVEASLDLAEACGRRPAPARCWSTASPCGSATSLYECGDSDAPEFEAAGAGRTGPAGRRPAGRAQHRPNSGCTGHQRSWARRRAADPARSRVRRSPGRGQSENRSARRRRVAGGSRDSRPYQIVTGCQRARDRSSSPRWTVGALPAISPSNPAATPPM